MAHASLLEQVSAGLIALQPLESFPLPVMPSVGGTSDFQFYPAKSNYSFVSFSSLGSSSSVASSSTSPSVYQLAQEATEHLVALCQTCDFLPSLEELTFCVNNGADILAHPPGQALPLLHTFIRAHQVALVRACLQTPRVLLSLTVLEGTDRCCTPGHCLCGKSIPDADSREMLLAFLERQETYPQEVGIDWGVRNGMGRTFLQLAADHQKLSLLWPLVSSQVYFVDHILSYKPLCLTGALVWRWDWEALRETQEQGVFSLDEAYIVEADRFTGQLCKYRWLGAYNVDDVRACVAGGAIVDFEFHIAGNVFYEYLRKAPEECVAALLQTTRPIALRFGDSHSTGGLLSLFAPGRSPADVARRLQLLVDRLRSPIGAKDMVRWLDDGLVFLAHAARCEMLSTVWPIIQTIPPFSTAVAASSSSSPRNRPIYPLIKVSAKDWAALSVVDRTCFSSSV